MFESFHIFSHFVYLTFPVVLALSCIWLFLYFQPFRVFDMRKFQQNVNRELRRATPDRLRYICWSYDVVDGDGMYLLLKLLVLFWYMILLQIEVPMCRNDECLIKCRWCFFCTPKICLQCFLHTETPVCKSFCTLKTILAKCYRLESQCVTAISFVKNEPELLDRLNDNSRNGNTNRNTIANTNY